MIKSLLCSVCVNQLVLSVMRCVTTTDNIRYVIVLSCVPFDSVRTTARQFVQTSRWSVSEQSTRLNYGLLRLPRDATFWNEPRHRA